MSEKRFYIHTVDDINKQLMDTESDFNIHIEELGSDEELLIQLCNLLNEQQEMIEAKDNLINILAKENESLRKQYNECEKFRYYVFEQLWKMYDEKDKHMGWKAL